MLFVGEGYFDFEIEDDALLVEGASGWDEGYLMRGVIFMQLLLFV